PQFNLLLSYELPIAVLNSPFVSANRDKAEKWIADPAPKELFFSHGQYFRGQRGVEHVIQELSRKRLSRRALLTTLEMDTLLAGGDLPVPAFSILQFCIDQNVLYVTAYFRALEVAA